jgi:hypothetical protein
MEKYSMDDDSKSKVIKIISCKRFICHFVVGKYSNGTLLLGKTTKFARIIKIKPR